MKFEHAATPFTYTLYKHTGSLHKKFKHHMENALLPPLFLPPPPLWRTPPPVPTIFASPPLLRIKWSRHKVAILTFFGLFQLNIL